MKLKVGHFGFWLLVFVGYCGEVPVSLVRKMDGYYDYNRRVVTKLVKEGYLKERKFQTENRHIVRSLSLTEDGLKQIQHLSPNHAAQVRRHDFAPKNGQGEWSRTQRLHRGAACLLAAMKLGAVWKPGKARDAAHGKQLVYYSTYQLNKSLVELREKIIGYFLKGAIRCHCNTPMVMILCSYCTVNGRNWQVSESRLNLCVGLSLNVSIPFCFLTNTCCSL